ncbi:MAG: YdcF family protein [Oscillospiraceae bacterium]|nr:YdcF family protein [Oscillospiraceae bacterium]
MKESNENENKQSKHVTARRRNITIVATIIAAIICGFFYILTQLRISHMHVFLMFFGCLSFLVLTYMVLWTLGASEKFSRIARILKRCYFVCLIIGVLCFVILQGLIISGTRTDDVEVDAIIVLGAGLINDRPSLILAYRLNATIEFVQTRDDIPIIVTGGLGPGRTITEAEAMARFLIERGIDENRIWREGASTSTHENINFAIEIMEENGMDVENIRVAIVSNEFHLYRARLVGERAGLNAYGVAAETPGWHRKAIYFFRETFSLANELIFRS